MGVIADSAKAVGLGIKQAGLHITLVGKTAISLGQSLYLREVHGIEAGAPPSVDFALEKQIADSVRAAILSGDVVACHDVSDGGLMMTLAEMMLAGFETAGLDLSGNTDPVFWYGEGAPAYVCLSQEPLSLDVAMLEIGMTTDTGTIVLNGQTIGTHAQLRNANEATLPAIMGEQKNAA